MTKTTRTTIEPAAHTFIDFRDMKDAKGRTIGCVAERGIVEHVEGEGTYGYYTDYAPGRYFTACVEATRNGRSYGAGQRTLLFASEASREAYITKRIADSSKAAAKKAAAL